jgi:hypothetical protein
VRAGTEDATHAEIEDPTSGVEGEG